MVMTMKMIRVLLPIFLIVLCLLYPADAHGAATKSPSGGEAVSITTAEQLAAIDISCAGKRYVLDADIHLPPGWVPIGHEPSGQALAFKGSLDGGGHSIIGLDIDAVTHSAVGLFARLEGACISNIVLVDPRMQISGGKTDCGLSAGLLAGEVVDSVIKNITIENGIISAIGPGLENAAVGGLAGRMKNSTVENTTANVQIRSNAEAAGGVVGLAIDTNFYNSGAGVGIVKAKNAAGGFAGRLEGTGEVLDCHSQAHVTGKVAGGFVGQITGSKLSANANHGLVISQCRATGKTTSNAGGIAGGFAGKGEYVLIRDSSAQGDVHGCAGAGGFVGRLSHLSRIIYASAKGDVLLEEQQAPVSPSGLPGFAGGFVGELTNSACVEFSYAAGSVIAGGGSETAVGGFVGYISASGAPNTITHCLSFAPWVVGSGYVHRFAGRTSHAGVNGCYAHLGSMVVRGGNLVHVLPSAFGQDGADMSMAQVEDVTRRLGWRRDVCAITTYCASRGESSD